MRRIGGAGLWLAAVAVMGAPRRPETPAVVSAYVDGGDLVFTPPDSIDWDVLLPPRLQPAAIAQNEALRRDLYEQRSDFGFTEIPFPVPLPSTVSSRFYYLLDSAGFREIRPAGLKGIARVYWKGNTSEIDRLQAHGYVKSDVISTGGFVLIADRKTTLTLEPSSLTADSLMSPGGGDYYGKGTPFRRVIRQYQIREAGPSANRWVFVQWLADTAMVEAGCTWRFSLFRLGAAPVSMATTDLGCDV